MLLAMDSTIDSIASLQLLLRTAITSASWCMSVPIVDPLLNPGKKERRPPGGICYGIKSTVKLKIPLARQLRSM
jgi:hypothetical protein